MLSRGVIEGFYGVSWSWEERRHMIDFLASHDFSSYWYAPKSDRYLRNHWQTQWPDEQFSQLQSLADYATDKSVGFGVGLSPLGLFENWNTEGRQQLKQRLQQIQQLAPSAVAVLFDDMWGELPALASTQIEIAHFVAEHIDVKQQVVCPSYYSFDPVLPELFGAMPEGYWAELGSGLDAQIDLFWTGDQVISRDYPQSGLQRITELFQRKPVIWDNSIANDGRKTSPFLNLRQMFATDSLDQSAKEVLVNPMNQPALSKLVLNTLNISSNQLTFMQSVQQLAPELEKLFAAHLDDLVRVGLDQLPEEAVEQIRSLAGNVQLPAADNIMDWLEGRYRFDPACLT